MTELPQGRQYAIQGAAVLVALEPLEVQRGHTPLIPTLPGGGGA